MKKDYYFLLFFTLMFLINLFLIYTTIDKFQLLCFSICYLLSGYGIYNTVNIILKRKQVKPLSKNNYCGIHENQKSINQKHKR